MPTLVELEQELRRLKEKQDTLESQLKSTPPRPSRPDASLTDILNIENGHTVWARTRKMPLSVRSPNSVSLNGTTDWPEGAPTESNMALVCPLPADWVVGTDMLFVAGIMQTATAGDRVVVMDSDISVELLNASFGSGVTFSDTNLESLNDLTSTLTQNETKLFARTITGATLMSVITDIDLKWRLQWILYRDPTSASDTVNGLVRFRAAWIEYTAFM